jgi:hypothetical protein
LAAKMCVGGANHNPKILRSILCDARVGDDDAERLIMNFNVV